MRSRALYFVGCEGTVNRGVNRKFEVYPKIGPYCDGNTGWFSLLKSLKSKKKPKGAEVKLRGSQLIKNKYWLAENSEGHG